MNPSEKQPYRHSVSVAGAVIDDEGRFLAIQRRDNDKWEIPGGILELRETPEEGVLREVLEETGVKVHVERLTGVYKNMERGIIALVFRCSVISGRPEETAEARSVAWLSADEIEAQVDEAYAVRFLDALNDDTTVRAHDGFNLL